MAAPRPDVVILTALEQEYAAVVRVLPDGGTHRWRGRELYTGRVGALEVLVYPLGSMGNVGSAEATALIISVWNPTYILLVGITGGFAAAGDDLRLGDVIVPDQIVRYEHAEVRPEGSRRRYEVHQPDWLLLQTARGIQPRDWALSIAEPRPDGDGARVVPQVFFAPVFSGEKVMADEATVAGLRQDWSQAIGVEMEALGVGLAAYRGGPRFIVVKAVSDFADPARNYGWHAYAAEAAARFAAAVLRNTPAPSRSEHAQAVPIGGPRSFPGPVKVVFCRRLGSSWAEVADFFEVEPHHRARFPLGDEPRRLWEWLEERDKLTLLPDALVDLGREDLAEILRPPTP